MLRLGIQIPVENRLLGLLFVSVLNYCFVFGCRGKMCYSIRHIAKTTIFMLFPLDKASMCFNLIMWVFVLFQNNYVFGFSLCVLMSFLVWVVIGRPIYFHQEQAWTRWVSKTDHGVSQHRPAQISYFGQITSVCPCCR